MPINISAALRRWLLEKRLKGYIQVTEAPTHPEALEITKKLNIDTVTNATIQKKLDLSSLGETFRHSPGGGATEILRQIFDIYQGFQNEGHP